jgi:uncharacterized membrane protein YdfJ with MMPL/SSD domain
MAGVLYRLGRLCANRALVVVAVWLGLVVGVQLVVGQLHPQRRPTIKQFGVGLSVAVLLAGAMVLSPAPAMLTLFGGATWWLPGWLARVLPHVDIEAQPGPPPGQEPAGEAASGAAMRAASRWRR